MSGILTENLRILLPLIPAFSWDTAGDVWGEKYLYSIIALFIARRCEPRAGPARSEALDIWASARPAERADG